MRLVRTEDKGVTRFDRSLAIFMAGNAVAGDDVIKLPLRAVGVIGISRFPPVGSGKSRHQTDDVPLNRSRMVFGRAPRKLVCPPPQISPSATSKQAPPYYWYLLCA